MDDNKIKRIEEKLSDIRHQIHGDTKFDDDEYLIKVLDLLDLAGIKYKEIIF